MGEEGTRIRNTSNGSKKTPLNFLMSLLETKLKTISKHACTLLKTAQTTKYQALSAAKTEKFLPFLGRGLLKL